MPSWNTLKVLCRNNPVIVQKLRNRGIKSLDDLSEVSETDILFMDFKDFVVRRRLLTWISLFPRTNLRFSTLEELCRHNNRTLTKLRKHGIQSLQDVGELNSEDVIDLNLLDLITFRRLLRQVECPGEHKSGLASGSSVLSLSPRTRSASPRLTQPRSPVASSTRGRVTVHDKKLVRVKNPLSRSRSVGLSLGSRRLLSIPDTIPDRPPTSPVSQDSDSRRRTRYQKRKQRVEKCRQRVGSLPSKLPLPSPHSDRRKRGRRRHRQQLKKSVSPSPSPSKKKTQVLAEHTSPGEGNHETGDDDLQQYLETFSQT